MIGDHRALSALILRLRSPTPLPQNRTSVWVHALILILNPCQFLTGAEPPYTSEVYKPSDGPGCSKDSLCSESPILGFPPGPPDASHRAESGKGQKYISLPTGPGFPRSKTPPNHIESVRHSEFSPCVTRCHTSRKPLYTHVV